MQTIRNTLSLRIKWKQRGLGAVSLKHPGSNLIPKLNPWYWKNIISQTLMQQHPDKLGENYKSFATDMHDSCFVWRWNSGASLCCNNVGHRQFVYIMSVKRCHSRVIFKNLMFGFFHGLFSSQTIDIICNRKCKNSVINLRYHASFFRVCWPYR